jgi:eukaryotic-like serine/threonine-protein kinase
MSLAVGTRLGAYEVLGLIGAGGMGEVYKARDTRLDRAVAIKVLPASVAADPGRLRLFEREARAVAALSHSNVLAVYDVGLHEKAPYLVMELLEGETLRARLAGGPLPVPKAVELGIQIARGMAAAHERGIVHGDVKPENVFVTTDGTVKLLDFGLAQVTERRRAEELASTVTATGTAFGTVRGTIGYMAPEQARGQPSDHRSDVFAFGCVLYEMLSGERAFAGDSVADTVAAILTKDPPPLDIAACGIPPALAEIVNRCLEKAPQERFTSAHDLALALRALSGSREPAVARRAGSWLRRHGVLVTVSSVTLVAAVALLIWTIGSEPVLSFAPRDWILLTDIDNQTGERIFDHSLTTAFTISLEQSTHANVFPRSGLPAVLKRMGRTEVPAITEALGREICVRQKIRALISPAISKVGQSYSLTARIIDPATGEAVRSYIKTAKSPDSVLPALGSLVETIRGDLGESLASIRVSSKDLPQVTTSSLEALSMYAEATGLWRKGKYGPAVELFLSALKADPDFAMAHTAVGNAYYSHIFNNPAEGKLHLERAMQLSHRTTQREAQIIRINYESGRGNYDTVRSLYEGYLATYPDDFATRYNFGNTLRDHGARQEAVAQFLEVLRVAPGHANALINLATSYSGLDKPQDALEAYARAFELEPDWVTSGNLNHEYGFTWVRVGDLRKAEEVFNKGLAASNKPLSTRSLALLDMYRGKYKSAIERLRDAVLLNRSAKAPLSESRNHLFLATAFEARGDINGTRTALEKAAECLRELKGQVWLPTRIGIGHARAGALEQAEQLLRKARSESEPANQQHSSDLHRLEGELALARGDRQKGVDLLLLADRENHSSLTQESVARAYRSSGDTDKAVAALEALLRMHDGSLGWEAQQGWLEAHYWLAALSQRSGNPRKALDLTGDMLARWKDADPDLPMLKRVIRLRSQVTALAGSH